MLATQRSAVGLGGLRVCAGVNEGAVFLLRRNGDATVSLQVFCSLSTLSFFLPSSLPLSLSFSLPFSLFFSMSLVISPSLVPFSLSRRLFRLASHPSTDPRTLSVRLRGPLSRRAGVQTTNGDTLQRSRREETEEQRTGGDGQTKEGEEGRRASQADATPKGRGGIHLVCSTDQPRRFALWSQRVLRHGCVICDL